MEKRKSEIDSMIDSVIVGRRVVSREGACLWVEEIEMSPKLLAAIQRQFDLAREAALRPPPWWAWWAWWAWLDRLFTPRGRLPTPWRGLDGLTRYEPSDQPSQGDTPPTDAGAR